MMLEALIDSQTLDPIAQKVLSFLQLAVKTIDSKFDYQRISFKTEGLKNMILHDHHQNGHLRDESNLDIDIAKSWLEIAFKQLLFDLIVYNICHL